MKGSKETSVTEKIELRTKYPFLTAAGIDMDRAEENGPVPVQEACILGDKKMLETLISLGAKVTQREGSVWGPLHLAAMKHKKSGDYKGVMELLLRHGAKVDIDKTATSNIRVYDHNRGNTPLHIAVKNGSKTLTTMLLEAGANPNLPGNNGRTPLLLASSSDMMELLLNHGASAVQKNSRAVVPLHVFIEQGPGGQEYKKKIKLLFKHGAHADINLSAPADIVPGDNNERNAALHLAIRKDDAWTVKKMMEHKADPNLPGANGWVPLELATNSFNIKIIELLVNGGANLGYLTPGIKQTCFEKALARNERKVVQFLLESGALLFYRDELPQLKGYNLAGIPVHPSVKEEVLMRSGAKKIDKVVRVTPHVAEHHPIWKQQLDYANAMVPLIEWDEVPTRAPGQYASSVPPNMSLIDVPTPPTSRDSEGVMKPTRSQSLGSMLNPERFKGGIAPTSLERDQRLKGHEGGRWQ